MIKIREMLTQVMPVNMFVDYYYFKIRKEQMAHNNYEIPKCLLDTKKLSKCSIAITNLLNGECDLRAKEFQYSKYLFRLNNIINEIISANVCSDENKERFRIAITAVLNYSGKHQYTREKEEYVTADFSDIAPIPYYVDYYSSGTADFSGCTITMPTVVHETVVETTSTKPEEPKLVETKPSATNPHESVTTIKLEFTEDDAQEIREKLRKQDEEFEKKYGMTYEQAYEEYRNSDEFIKNHIHNKPQPCDPVTDMDDIQRIRYHLRKNNKIFLGLRNDAVFVTGISTGLRCVDLLNLKLKDVIQSSENFYTAEDDKPKAKYVRRIIAEAMPPKVKIFDEISCCESKTHKMNHPKLSKTAQKAITDYLFARHANGDKMKPNDYLFASQKKDSRLSSHTYYQILNKIQKELNLPYHLGSHSMRKTFAYWTVRQHYYDQNILFSLQEMLNHDSVKTTLHYSGHTSEHIAQMYDDMESVINGTAKPAEVASPEEQKIDKILNMLSKLGLDVE